MPPPHQSIQFNSTKVQTSLEAHVENLYSLNEDISITLDSDDITPVMIKNPTSLSQEEIDERPKKRLMDMIEKNITLDTDTKTKILELIKSTKSYGGSNQTRKLRSKVIKGKRRWRRTKNNANKNIIKMKKRKNIKRSNHKR